MRRNRAVAHREVEGQAIIILPRTNEVIVLNATGTLVWSLSDGEHDVDAVAAELVDRFGISLEEARSDVESLYRELIEAGAAQNED